MALNDDNERVLYEIADVFERCGLHPLALYEGLHPLAMEHNRDGLGKMLNSMLGCLQQAGEPPDRHAVSMDDYFGLCPECHKTDGYLNAGKSHDFFCKEHKKRWWAGSNIFSTWRAETEAEQRQKWAEVGMDDFEDITGNEYHPPFPPVAGVVLGVLPATRWPGDRSDLDAEIPF